MKNSYWIIWAIIVTLSGCTEQSEDSSSDVTATVTPARGVTDSEVVFGAYSDFSGPTAIWGVGSINAARMRFDAANEAGGVHGRRIRFVVEDMQYQVPRAIQAANKLLNRDNVFAMVLAVGTPMNNAIMRQQFELGVPNLFPISGARSMVQPLHPLKFTQRGIYYDEIRAAVKFFVESKGKKNVCAVYQDTEYGQEIFEAVEDQTKSMGIAIATHSTHKPTETEFTATILRLKKASCDLVLMGTVHRDTILVLYAARKLGLTDVAWVGSNATFGQVIADQDSGEGYYAFVHMAKLYPEDEKSPAVQAWWDEYMEKYGAEPGLAAMEGYRAADLVVHVLEATGPDLTVDQFLASLESLSDYTDIFGYNISFSKQKHSGATTSVLSQVQNGKWIPLEQSISY